MRFPQKIDIDKVIDLVNSCGPNTRVYIGSDSERINVGDLWFADYATVVVVHMDGNRGGKVFGAIVRERDYDSKQNRPSYRLMNEVYKTAEIYLELVQRTDIDIEIHLDINTDESCGSSCVVQQAIGYIKGMCNIEPKVKPNGFAASNAADQLKRMFHYGLK